MQTNTQKHEFSNIPIRCADITVARLSGEVVWKLKEDGTVINIRELHLRGERGEMVEVLPNEEIWPVTVESLKVYAKGRRDVSPRGDEVPVSPVEYDPAVNPDLDNAAVEGSGS